MANNFSVKTEVTYQNLEAVFNRLPSTNPNEVLVVKRRKPDTRVTKQSWCVRTYFNETPFKVLIFHTNEYETKRESFNKTDKNGKVHLKS